MSILSIFYNQHLGPNAKKTCVVILLLHNIIYIFFLSWQKFDEVILVARRQMYQKDGEIEQ